MIKEDPYASMEKDQLISMIHFLVKREDEPTNEVRVESNSFELYLARRRKNIIQRAQENQELKDMVRDLRDTHKQDVKTQSCLMKSIDRLTNQVADLTTQNKTLQQKVNDLLSQISVGNKVRFVKGSEHLKKVLPVLKERLLAKGAVVNCDETWCRVKVAGKYGKKYIWCMVNKEAKVAVYFYDDGSRGRQVLRDFLGNTEIDALQSDGFNVYMYLDKELVDVDHLCCLAHARAKFKYAMEQGKDTDAEYFVTNIGRLYDLEEQYRLRHLTPKQIQEERQGEQTTKIIQRMRQRLDKLLADTSGMRGDLMHKALNYLNSFWSQLILYLKDGRYSIDNTLAERALRPMTVERKNSLTFGSHDGAEVSVIYHTFIETCKMCGVSTLEYFKEFFKAIMQGRTDYEKNNKVLFGLDASGGKNHPKRVF